MHDSVTDPSRAALLDEIARGMSLDQKELPAKLFYDRRGSELFERITELPEYYPTRTERALLSDRMPEWMAELRPRALVELGAGSASKTRLVLDAMCGAGRAERYYPVDVSAEFLEATADAVRAEYPRLEVVPVVADIAAPFRLPERVPRPALVAFLGSTIGNFEPHAAVGLLGRVARGMQPDDRFLLGVDLRKDPARIEAAYNDAQGVTAEFNRNMLLVLRREFGAELEPERFRHRAFYDRARHRIEMHLVAEAPQRIRVPGAGEWTLARGESIRSEISCKHDRDSVTEMFHAAGLRLERWSSDADDLYALALAAPAEANP